MRVTLLRSRYSTQKLFVPSDLFTMSAALLQSLPDLPFILLIHLFYHSLDDCLGVV